MKAIDFVVRDQAGGLQRGVVSADAEAHVIQAQAGQEISLNLRQTDISGQTRSGNDLVMTLSDGRVITIDNYFNSGGDANRLFISSEGYLNEVAFVDTGSGELFAQYGPTQEWGKWSPSDDLIYLGRTEMANAGSADEEVSMFAAPLLGGGLFGSGLGAAAAAAGGIAAAAGLAGGGSDSEDPAPAAPFVDNPDDVTNIGGDDNEVDTLIITGGGEPGDRVVVQIGEKTVETEVGEDGVYQAVFEEENFPADGTYETVVTVTTAGGDVILDGPAFTIDTTPPALAITSGTGSVDDVFNGEEFEQGVTLTGTGEAGASIDVTIAGITQSTVVADDGTWMASWEIGSLEGGEYTTDVLVVSRDSFGNSTTINDTLVVDTVTNVSINTDTVEGDGTVNAEEAMDGVTLTGTAQAGATVVVSFGTGTHTASVDADGNWSVDFAMSDVPTGEQSATVTAVATDSFGNSSTTTGQVDIDTLVRDFGFTGTTGGADGVINIAEAAEGLTMTGTTEPGATVSVTLNGFTHDATVAPNGSWTVDFAAGEIPTGETTVIMSATATDAAGNAETITREVEVDRDAGVLTISGAPIEGDDVVNAAEASDGVTLTGTSNAGATVTVTLDGNSATTVTDAAGNWSVDYAAGLIRPGTYTADITAETVDPAGNPLSATHSVQVDTEVLNLSIDTGAVGAGDGVINAAERLANGGMQITGTTEAGSSAVVVSLNGQDVTATVDAAGNWSATFTAGQVDEGTYNANVTVTATDAAGNMESATGTIRVDTEVVPFSMDGGAGGSDGVLSAAEAATGIDLGGQVEAGSTVVVNFDGTDHTAAVDAAGNWSLTIPPSDIRAGTYDAAISVTATDAVGNVDQITDTLAIDTDAPDGPVIASLTRDGDGIRGISTEIQPDDLAVFEVDGSTVSDVPAVQTDVDALGETLFTFGSDVPDGSDLVVTATDAAGNLSGTYIGLDDESAGIDNVDLDAGTLGGLNVEVVDLKFVEDGHLDIDEALLTALSTNSNALTILGGSDDSVTINGAVANGSETRDGTTFNVYMLGDEGMLYIDDEISVTI